MIHICVRKGKKCPYISNIISHSLKWTSQSASQTSCSCTGKQAFLSSCSQSACLINGKRSSFLQVCNNISCVINLLNYFAFLLGHTSTTECMPSIVTVLHIFRTSACAVYYLKVQPSNFNPEEFLQVKV